MLTPAELKSMTTFDDAVERMDSFGVFTLDQYHELTGFGILPGTMKSVLVGVPFLIVQYQFRVGKYDSSFVECHIITTQNNRYFMRDSSRGIHEQLRQIHRDRVAQDHPAPEHGVYARKGLDFRDNPYETPDGVKLTSRTYYIA